MKKEFLYPLLILLLFNIDISYSGIILDGTLGRGGTLTGPNYSISSDLGRQLGSNLFHSFRVFDLSKGESATFTGPTGIINVISRVTGGQASNIDGMLSNAIKGANLYFINPSGVIIGQNASIDMSGSLHISTANYLRLGKEGIFHASIPSESILTSAPPSAFGFLSNPKDIKINGGQIFRLSPLRQFSLTGGNISIDNADIRAESGTIFIASLASAGEVDLDTYDTKLFNSLGNINLKDTLFSVNGYGNGNISLIGGNITIGNSLLSSVHEGNATARGISINARNHLTLSGSQIQSITEGTGTGGDIYIRGGDIILDRGSKILSQTTASANAGKIDILSNNNLSLIGESQERKTGIYSQSSGTGSTGDILIGASTFLMNNYSVLLNHSIGQGVRGIIDLSARLMELTNNSVIQGGNIYGKMDRLVITTGAYIWSIPMMNQNNRLIKLNLSDSLIIKGEDQNQAPWRSRTSALYTGIHTDSFTTYWGDAADIEISSPFISITNSGQIGARTYTNNRAGNITISTQRMQILSGGQIGTDSYGSSGFLGNAGNIIINASESLVLSGRRDELFSGFSSSTRSSGGSGNISINSPHIYLGDEAGIVVATGVFGTGSAGTIKINTGKIIIDSHAGISASNAGYGIKEGLIDVYASEGIVLKDRGFIVSWGDKKGSAGSVYLKTPALLMDRGYISTITYGDRDAGAIYITAGEIIMCNGSNILSESQSIFPGGKAGSINIVAGRLKANNSSIATASKYTTGGNISIRAEDVQLTDKAYVSANVGGGEGAGGNVAVLSDSLVMLSDSNITARADQGYGGNISINSKAVILSRDSIMDASSNITGREGTVSINAPTVDVAGNMAILSSSFLDIEALKPRLCSNKAEDISTFIIGGREGLPPTP